MAVMMILAAATIPAARQLMKSFETSTGVRRLISAALCNGRAIAAKEQRYAGVRFQQDLKGNQYMIFIIHDPTLKPLANGFRAVKGKKPIKLPSNVGVMDLYIRLDLVDAKISDDKPIEAFDVTGNVDTAASNANINDNHEVMDTTTFSIVFSPTGKLVVHDVRVHDRTSLDDVFNTTANVDADADSGMFYQDDYAALGLGQERSRKWFVVYDKNAFGAVGSGSRWSNYLADLDKVYVNPRTGEVINN